MTPQHPDVAAAVLALDQAMIALAVAKSALLGETSAPVPLASLRDRPHFDAASAAEVAEGAEPVVRPEGCICIAFSDTGGFRIADLCCPVHGVGGTQPGDGPWENASPAAPFPHFPHLPQHVHGSPVCILCGIDHDAPARIAPPPHALPAIEKTGGAL